MRISTLLLVTLLACRGSPPAPQLLNPGWGVILPQETVHDITTPCSRESAGPVEASWTPTADQIQDLEQLLPALLDSALVGHRSSPTGQPHVSDYYRQYVGVIVHGRSLIYVNGFHRLYVVSTTEILTDTAHTKGLPHIPPALRNGNFWHGMPVGVCDGGALFFGVLYDPRAKRFEHFAFNGNA